MIKDGALDPKPDAAFGLHVWQDMDLGEVAVTPGPWMAAVNDPAMAAMARAAAAEVVGRDHVHDDVRTMGGEDFSYMLAEVPGCFIAIGSRNKAKGLTFAHHHPRFDVDERCLEIGAEVLLR